jgi:hypothetical protein
MPNTANYSFPTPADTDLVKNGADAIRDLGDAVDTAMNTALGTKKSGLVLLNTTSFSGVASQSVNDVFSATYDNYKILLNNFTGSTGTTVNMRLRVSGADASGTNYNRELLSCSNTTVSAVRSTGLNSFEAISRMQGSTPIMTDIHLVNPFIASETTAKIQDTEGQVGTNINLLLATFNHTLATSYTGFTLLSGGNMTGSVSVYGYNK